MARPDSLKKRDDFTREGLLYGGGIPPQDGLDTPVFDRAVYEPSRELPLHVPFRRTDRDRRPGTPLPPEATGDPHPDRLARAEALRELLCKRDARLKIEGSVDRIDLTNNPGGLGTPKRRGGANSLPKTPDIEKPRATYKPVSPDIAKIEARRDGQVLFFATASEAAFCITGERLPKWIKAVQNVASGNTRKAFGWDFIRLRARAMAKARRRA